MATGRQAFSGPTWAVTVHAILGQAPMSLNESMPGLPQRLQEIIDKCLIKNRDLRYQSAAEVHHDLLKLKKDFEAGKSLKSVRSGDHVVAAKKVAAGDRLRQRCSCWWPQSCGVRASCASSATSVAGPAAQSASGVRCPCRNGRASPYCRSPTVAGDPEKLTAFGKGLLEDVAAKLSQLSANA